MGIVATEEGGRFGEFVEPGDDGFAVESAEGFDLIGEEPSLEFVDFVLKSCTTLFRPDDVAYAEEGEIREELLFEEAGSHATGVFVVAGEIGVDIASAHVVLQDDRDIQPAQEVDFVFVPPADDGIGFPFPGPIEDPFLLVGPPSEVGGYSVKQPGPVFLRVFHDASEQFAIEFTGAVNQQDNLDHGG